jgi:hypothetical protein
MNKEQEPEAPGRQKSHPAGGLAERVSTHGASYSPVHWFCKQGRKGAPVQESVDPLGVP